MNVPKKIQIALLALATMGVMSGVSIVASLPLISHHFSGVQDIEFLSKLLLTIPSIIVALFAPISGIVIDKVGRLKPLSLGVVLFVLGGSSGYYLDNFYLILIGRAILGLSVALIMTSSMALVGDCFQDKAREQFMSLQGMVVGLGGVVFVSLGGYLAHFGWNYPFLIYALPIMFIPIFLSAFKGIKKHQKTQELDALEDKARLFPVYLTGFFSMLLFYMLPTQMPYLVINDLGGTPSDIGHFIAFAMLINAFVAKQYSRLRNHFSFQGIFVITYVFFAIGLFIISKVTMPSQMYFASLFMGVGFGLVIVNINVWLLSLVQAHKRGRAIGLLTSSFFLGQFFSPILFEPIVSQIGIQGLFFVVSMLCFVIAGALYIFTVIKKASGI
ncbi:MFS transporter [Sulfurimonas sp. MAG313]|nr:MFS transporter [Sulfurimonas sp. MAG313]MDF1880049.1 MFS transporter [Sulfurimonas sp. MAG313]